MPAGSPFRFSLGLKQGDVPPGASISLKDGAGTALAVQVDAIIYWPDGSVRWCEIRGCTARAIGAAAGMRFQSTATPEGDIACW
jgi:exo-rhamnogalacturonan lyase-like protein